MGASASVRAERNENSHAHDHHHQDSFDEETGFKNQDVRDESGGANGNHEGGLVAAMMTNFEKEIECCICMTPMDADMKRPKHLTCGHSFCMECLSSMVQSGKIVCPNCREETNCNAGGAGLKDNHQLKSVVEKFTEMKIQQEKAAHAKSGAEFCQLSPNHGQVPVTEYCLKCKSLMCLNCALYDRTCVENTDQRHSVRKLAAVVDGIRKEVKLSYNDALLEISGLVQLLSKADQICRQDAEAAQILEEGKSVADKLNCYKVISDSNPRMTLRSSSELPVLVARAKTQLAFLGGEGEASSSRSFNKLSLVGCWKVEDASFVQLTPDGKSVVVSSNKGKQGLRLFSVNGQDLAARSMFPSNGSFRGMAMTKSKLIVIADCSGSVRNSSGSSGAIQIYSFSGALENTVLLNRAIKYASGVAVTKNDSYCVLDSEKTEVFVLTQNGAVEKKIAHPDLKSSYGIAISNNKIIITDIESHQVLCFDFTGKLQWCYGSKGGAVKGKLNQPLGVTADQYGQIYVSDWMNDRIVVLDQSGEWKCELTAPGLVKPMTLNVCKDILAVRLENLNIQTFKLSEE